MHQVTKSTAAVWAPYKNRVNALAPRYVDTETAPVDEARLRRRPWLRSV